MGVAISGWALAAAVSRLGQLGVVSGTALEVVCTRRLQLGDPGGHVRRALASFPDPDVAAWILDAYLIEGGKAPTAAFAAVPRWTIAPSRRLQELTVAANFVEVFLAKEGHDGVVGINYLRKIELPLPFACYGAMLAGVDYVLMGAGNPSDLPGLVRRLARPRGPGLAGPGPGGHLGRRRPGGRGEPPGARGLAAPPLPVPAVLAIVASVDLAVGLAGDPESRPDGFVVEGPSAGGHNAPPRGPRRVDAEAQPIYDERDVVDVPAIVALGLPVWLAGSYGTPEGLRRAVADGAVGVQVGTAFALCRESGMDPELKRRVLAQVASGEVSVRSDWRVSPTGFPFRVVELEATLSDPDVVSERQRVCDLGVLRSPYRTADGGVDYRCPSEPTAVYIGRKGGREVNTEGRTCLCNALLASAGLPQQRPHGYVEPALVTAGSDFSSVGRLLGESPDGMTYSAGDVVRLLLDG